jgi:hypothetical protein
MLKLTSLLQQCYIEHVPVRKLWLYQNNRDQWFICAVNNKTLIFWQNALIVKSRVSRTHCTNLNKFISKETCWIPKLSHCPSLLHWWCIVGRVALANPVLQLNSEHANGK